MITPTINQVIKELPANFVNFDVYKQFPIPTETIVTKVGLYYPRMGASYITDLYIHDNRIFSYNELSAYIGSDFRGSCNYEQLLLVECWNDWGDDGHLVYRRDAWKYVSKNEFDRYYNKLVSDDYTLYSVWFNEFYNFINAYLVA